MAVTPVPGLNSAVAVGGTAVVAVGAIPAGVGGGFITNPYTAADQGVANAEPIYIDPTGADPGLAANGTTFALWPGSRWNLIPGQATETKVNAASNGHKFSVVYWLAP